MDLKLFHDLMDECPPTWEMVTNVAGTAIWSAPEEHDGEQYRRVLISGVSPLIGAKILGAINALPDLLKAYEDLKFRMDGLEK